ncbi:hypothetical protein [Haloarchaeobius sp. TZWSO28]|uniref:hypothetical protein n=1 Tax=Haloarchaeobius sp. TZWSO28 TaxID=3446119 RepID=UPI003EC06C8D
MATKTDSAGPTWLHNPAGIDVIDSFLAPFFVMATAAMAGIATVGTDAPVTVYMSDVLYSITNGPEITVGAAVTFVTILVAWGTNKPKLSEMDDWLDYVAPAMIGVNVLYVLVPAFADFVGSSWIFGFALIGLNGAGFYLLAYH